MTVFNFAKSQNIVNSSESYSHDGGYYQGHRSNMCIYSTSEIRVNCQRCQFIV